jgi:hypothetical protein
MSNYKLSDIILEFKDKSKDFLYSKNQLKWVSDTITPITFVK